MTKFFQILALSSFFIIIFGQASYGQNIAIAYHNDFNAYYNKTRPKDTISALAGLRFFEPKINEIILNPDATFVLWSRPNVSCFTWQSYKGTWTRDKDTVIFSALYQIEENDIKAIYKRGSKQEFLITFKTDKGSYPFYQPQP